jgi:hypothetical protein
VPDRALVPAAAAGHGLPTITMTSAVGWAGEGGALVAAWIGDPSLEQLSSITMTAAVSAMMESGVPSLAEGRATAGASHDNREEEQGTAGNASSSLSSMMILRFFICGERQRGFLGDAQAFEREVAHFHAYCDCQAESLALALALALALVLKHMAALTQR